jgi:hypothetical membrane protein
VTAAEPSRRKKRILTIAGVSCFVAAIVGAVLINGAALSAPGPFSLTQNWYSDLGGMGYEYFLNVSRPIVNSYTTELMSRSAQLIMGVLLLVGSAGLYYDEEMPSYRVGAIFIALSGIGLIGVAVFPEPIVLVHLVASYVMFVSGATAALLIGSSLFDGARKPLGLLVIVLGIVAVVGTAFVSDLRGVAELAWWLAGLVLLIVLGVKMMRHASHVT